LRLKKGNKGMRIQKPDQNDRFTANRGMRNHQINKAVPHSVKRKKSCSKRVEVDSGSSNSTKSMEFEAEKGK